MSKPEFFQVHIENRTFAVKALDDVDAKMKAEQYNMNYEKEFTRCRVNRLLASDKVDQQLDVSAEDRPVPFHTPLAYRLTGGAALYFQNIWFTGKADVSLQAERFGTGAPNTYDRSSESTVAPQCDELEVPLFGSISTTTTRRDEYNGYSIDKQGRMAQHYTIDIVPWTTAHSVVLGLMAVSGAPVSVE